MTFEIVDNSVPLRGTGVASAVGIFGNPVLLCVLGSHTFFNLKEAAEHGVNVGTNWSSYSHSDLGSIYFNEPPAADSG